MEARSKAVKGNFPKDRPRVSFNAKDSLPHCHWIPDVSCNNYMPRNSLCSLCASMFQNGPWYSSLEHGQTPTPVPKGNNMYTITYQPNTISIEPFTTFSDADHRECNNSSRSTSKLETGAISWSQSCKG